ncbi:RDD family protein [bacterium]|nr:RDD family protein [bacterium]
MVQTRFAPFLKRFVAFLIDLVASLIVARVLLIPLRMLVQPHDFFGDPFAHWGILGRMAGGVCSWLPSPGWLFGVNGGELLGWASTAVFVLYFSVFESSWRQATPGKMALGIFVTDEQGRRLSFPRALGRTLGKLLSTACCLIGYIIALFSRRSQALHDLIANTLVLEPCQTPSLSEPPQAEPPRP